MSLRINAQHPISTANLDSPNSPDQSSEFSGILFRAQRIQKIDLQSFLSRLEIQGKKLSETLSLRDLYDFRDMVKTFLRSTFGQSRIMQEESSWDWQGWPKLMSRVTKIDYALDTLGEQLLNQQAKPLQILSKIDEIRGLIIDLFA